MVSFTRHKDRSQFLRTPTTRLSFPSRCGYPSIDTITRLSHALDEWHERKKDRKRFRSRNEVTCFKILQISWRAWEKIFLISFRVVKEKKKK